MAGAGPWLARANVLDVGQGASVPVAVIPPALMLALMRMDAPLLVSVQGASRAGRRV